MNDKDLGPQPDPITEEPQLHPGGADAVKPDEEDNGLGRDLDPEDNPAVDDVLPEGVAERDDEKKQAPEGKADDAEEGTQRDPDAGQQAEDGSTEPPA